MTGVRSTRKAQRRRDILEAAAVVFSEVGYHGATFSTIAERMGASKSAIGYHHFPSKHAIAVELVEIARGRWQHMIQEVTASSATRLEKLLTLLLSAALDARNNSLAAAAIRIGAEQRTNGFTLPPATFSWRGVAHDLIWESLETGEIPSGSRVEDVVSLILTSSYGVFVSENQGFEPMRTQKHLQDVWRTILVALSVENVDALLDNLQPLDLRDGVAVTSDASQPDENA